MFISIFIQMVVLNIFAGNWASNIHKNHRWIKGVKLAVRCTGNDNTIFKVDIFYSASHCRTTNKNKSLVKFFWLNLQFSKRKNSMIINLQFNRLQHRSTAIQWQHALRFEFTRFSPDNILLPIVVVSLSGFRR